MAERGEPRPDAPPRARPEAGARRIRLYCSVNEPYPFTLVDITELFFDALRDRGIEQVWFSPSGPAGGGRFEVAPGVEVRVAPRRSAGPMLARIASRLAGAARELHSLLRAFAAPFDIVQARDRYWVAAVGALVSRLTGRPFCIWLSFPFPEYQIDEAPHRPWPERLYLAASGRLGLLLLYRIAMPRASVCFVQSDQMRLDLHRIRGVPWDRMHVVPMGIPRRALARNPSVIRAEPPSGPAAVRTVIYTGTLIRSRRLSLMIEAFDRVAAVRDDVTFVVVGDSPDPADRKRLEAQAVTGALRGRIRFTGRVPIEQAWDEIAAADIGVSPFHDDRVLRVASPTKLVEYWAFGKAVVANDHPEQNRMLSASGGGLTVPWSVRGFADGISTLLDDARLRVDMGERGRSWVLAHRDYERLADDVLKVYEDLLD